MSNITREDVILLARLSRLDIAEAEIDELVKDFDSVLEYVGRLDVAVKKYTHEILPHAVNIFRDDYSQSSDVRPLLRDAPAIEDDYFVVPVIIKEKE